MFASSNYNGLAIFAERAAEAHTRAFHGRTGLRDGFDGTDRHGSFFRWGALPYLGPASPDVASIARRVELRAQKLRELRVLAGLLEELRQRLFVCIGAVAVGFIVAYVFHDRLGLSLPRTACAAQLTP